MKHDGRWVKWEWTEEGNVVHMRFAVHWKVLAVGTIAIISLMLVMAGRG